MDDKSGQITIHVQADPQLLEDEPMPPPPPDAVRLRSGSVRWWNPAHAGERRRRLRQMIRQQIKLELRAKDGSAEQQQRLADLNELLDRLKG